MARIEPQTKNAFVFIDGQNLYRSVKNAFGYNYPNYDINLLSEKLCSLREWHLKEIYFYTGVPDSQDDLFWNTFWRNKLSFLGRSKNITIFSRSLRYHNESFKCPACDKHYTSLIGHEKGIDVRLSLDVIRLAHEKLYDVALVISQDQDLKEVADEVERISREQERWIKIASAFPNSPTYKQRGINGTDWMKFDKELYDQCIDQRDYR